MQNHKMPIKYIRYIYIKRTEKKYKNLLTLVAEIAIDGKLHYVTLWNEHGINPIGVKRMANSGVLGPKINLSDRVTIECTPYKTSVYR